jgi:hypothetical protein
MTVKGFGDGGSDEPCPPEEMADPDEVRFRAMLIDLMSTTPEALILEWDEIFCAELFNCKVTSRSEKAERILGTGESIVLTQAQVRWLHERLGELIALQDKAQ